VRCLDGGRERAVRARYVVDASGSTGRLHQLVGGSREFSEFFRNLALFGYYENGKRLAGDRAGNILCIAFNGGWFWYIPLSDTLTSVGAVVRREFATRIQGDPERALASFVAECPTVQDYLAGAHRVTEGVYGKVRVRKDYSYHQTRFWRPGMVCVGDAACFVDPVFSSGVHLATYGALLAARSICSTIAGLVPESEAFREFENRYRREYAVFYEFLTSFYDMHADEQSYFWRARKVTRSDRREQEAFVELVGGLSSGEFDLAGPDAVARGLAAKSAEITDAVNHVREDPDGSMMPLLTSSVVRAAMRESAEVQARAQRGGGLGAKRPMFPGGLVPSPDGLLWQRPA
jgi:halogenation protein CepH